MKTALLALPLLAFLLLAAPADAGLRRQCLDQCLGARLHCFVRSANGVTLATRLYRRCRRRVTRACVRHGLAVCQPPFDLLDDLLGL